VIAEEEIVFTLDAEALPFGLGDFEDESVEEGVFDGVLIAVEPGMEELEPVFFVFVGEDESGGAHTVTGGVAGGDGPALGTGRAGMAAVTFLDFGMIDGGIREILFVGKHIF
jgi:hypothetical protein